MCMMGMEAEDAWLVIQMIKEQIRKTTNPYTRVGND